MAKPKIVYRYRRKPKKKHRRAKPSFPLAVIAGFAAALAEPAQMAMKGNYVNAADTVSTRFTGYSFQKNTFDVNAMKAGLLPVVVGLLAHKIVGSWLGLNRALGRAKIPYLRV